MILVKINNFIPAAKLTLELTLRIHTLSACRLWPTKMLHNVLNGCFGEAAVQHLDIWPKAGVGRS